MEKNRNTRLRTFVLLATAVSLLLLSACSLNRVATRMTADSLTSPEGRSVFSSDEDPELVADALPFGLKMYEGLLASLPEHEGLLLASAEGFVSYAHGFILSPAGRLGYSELDKAKKMKLRARDMFIRGRDYALDLLDVRYPGFRDAVAQEEFGEQLQRTERGDVEALYWAAAGWMGAISAAGLDISMIMQLGKPVALMSRAFELDPDYQFGMIHTFFIQIYGAVPSPSMLYGSTKTGAHAQKRMEEYYREAMGEVPKDPEKAARHHLERAVALSDGEIAGPYVAFASTFPVDNQDSREYTRLLEKALAIDPNLRPAYRLMNILDQRQAKWMLDHMEDTFITYSDSE